MTGSEGSIDLIYGVEDKPPTLETIFLGIQHIAAMIVPNIAVALIVGGAVGIGTANTAFIVQMVIIFAGLATLVQVFPIGPIGARLPVVMGTSFAFVGAAIAIGTQYGLGAVFGAILIAAPVEILIGWQFKRIKRFFPPLVTGLIVVILGLYLIPVGMDYVAGGQGASDYGALYNLGLAGIVLAISVGLNLLSKGTLRILSLLIGLVVGYVAAIALGVVDFSPVVQAGWFALPTPGRFGFQFEPIAILTFVAIHITAAIESIGDISGITAAEGRTPTDEEVRGGLFVDGIGSAVGAVFGAFPLTTFSQNVGIINFTGVMSRYVVGVGGVVLLVLGFIPKVGAVISTIPSAVLGGAVLVMFGMVMASGLKLIFENETLNRRNMVIMASSIGLGLGVEVRPDALQALPDEAKIFFGNAIIVTAIVAIVLNTLAPREDESAVVSPEVSDSDAVSPSPSTGSDDD